MQELKNKPQNIEKQLPLQEEKTKQVKKESKKKTKEQKNLYHNCLRKKNRKKKTKSNIGVHSIRVDPVFTHSK